MHEKNENPINILIDKKHYTFTEENVSGAQLKSIGSVPAGYQLWLQNPGSKDTQVSDTDSVHLKSGMKFFSVKPSIDNGGF